MNIFVGNLSRYVTEDELFNIFAQFGNVKIVKNQSTNESKGYGFVEMQDLSEAHKARDLLNIRELKGKRLTVKEGRSKRFDRGKEGFSRYGNDSNKRH